jgi:hypothetical protein
MASPHQMYGRGPNNPPQGVYSQDYDRNLVQQVRSQYPQQSSQSYPGHQPPAVISLVNSSSFGPQPSPQMMPNVNMVQSIQPGMQGMIAGQQQPPVAFAGPSSQIFPGQAAGPMQQNMMQTAPQGVPPGAVMLEVPTPGKFSINSGFVTLKPTQEQMQGFDAPSLTETAVSDASRDLVSFGLMDSAAPNAALVRWTIFFSGRCFLGCSNDHAHTFRPTFAIVCKIMFYMFLLL